MNVKIDTKEKFKEITLLESNLSANMTDGLVDLFKGILETDNKNVVLSLENVEGMEPEFAVNLAAIQNKFYDNNCSFVICGLKPAVEKMLEENELIESMNITATLSEAWDILQMEEIERDLLSDF